MLVAAGQELETAPCSHADSEAYGRGPARPAGPGRGAHLNWMPSSVPVRDRPPLNTCLR